MAQEKRPAAALTAGRGAGGALPGGEPIQHTSPKPMVENALAWAKRGFRVFPLHVMSKVPLWKGWTEDATTDDEEIRRVWTGNDHNIGVLCNDLVVIDVDIKDGKDGFGSFLELGLSLETLTVRTPSGGRHFYYRGFNASLSAGKLGEGLDIRSFHGYTLAPGSVLSNGAYEIETDWPIAPADPSLIARLDAPLERVSSEPLVELDEASAVQIGREWLEQSAPIAIQSHAGDTETYKVACRLKDEGISEDKAFELMWTHWNDRCSPPWDCQELAIKVANAYAYGKRRPGVDSPAHVFAGVHIEAPPQDRECERPRLRFLSDADANTEPAWLIKHLLPTVGVALLFGQSRVGKSFLLNDLAGALATALAWFDRAVRERVAVLIIVGEGGSTMAPRLEALRRFKLGQLPAADLPIAWVEVDDDKDLEGIIVEAAEMMRERFGLRLGMVAIDTLSAVFNVQLENDPAMATTVMKRLDRLSRRFACLALGVTHAGKDASLGIRGSSAWTASADVILGATGDIDEETGVVSRRRIALTKTRFDEAGPISGFELDRVNLGLDADGEPIRSAVIRPCVSVMKAPKPTIHSRTALACLEEVIEGHGREIDGRLAGPRELVRDLFPERCPAARHGGNVARAFSRAVAGAGIREVTTADGAWLIPPEND